jgi:hypothetical protein
VKYMDKHGPTNTDTKCKNEIRLVTTNLKRHIPSQLSITGTMTLIDYDAQDNTRYTCNEYGHFSSMCPHKRSARPTLPTSTQDAPGSSWANVVKSPGLVWTKPQS